VEPVGDDERDTTVPRAPGWPSRWAHVRLTFPHLGARVRCNSRGCMLRDPRGRRSGARAVCRRPGTAGHEFHSPTRVRDRIVSIGLLPDTIRQLYGLTWERPINADSIARSSVSARSGAHSPPSSRSWPEAR
jgi:hypothetical protein